MSSLYLRIIYTSIRKQIIDSLHRWNTQSAESSMGSKETSFEEGEISWYVVEKLPDYTSHFGVQDIKTALNNALHYLEDSERGIEAVGSGRGWFKKKSKELLLSTQHLTPKTRKRIAKMDCSFLFPVFINEIEPGGECAVHIGSDLYTILRLLESRGQPLDLLLLVIWAKLQGATTLRFRHDGYMDETLPTY